MDLNLPNAFADDDFSSRVVEIVAKEGSSIAYASVNTSHGHSFIAKQANVDKDASVQWIECSFNSNIIHANLTARLAGEGSSTDLRSLFIGEGDAALNLDVKTIHDAPNTKSRMLGRGVLHGRARAVSKGLVKIQQNAAGCDGFQEQHGLLLSEEASFDPVPVLEIHNDDVKCSHATTVSDIDDEKIYYMMSRGLDKAMARRSVVEGFVGCITKEAPEEASHIVETIIRERLLEMQHAH